MNAEHTNRTALVAGSFFVVMGGVFLLDQIGVFDLEIAYVIPALLIVLGVAVLLGGRRPRPEETPRGPDTWVGEPQVHPDPVVPPPRPEVHPSPTQEFEAAAGSELADTDEHVVIDPATGEALVVPRHEEQP